MSKDILMVVDAVSNEKGVEKHIIFEAIEAALASATRRKHGEDIEVRVAIDRESGEYETFRRWLVFDDESTELETPDRELRMIDALDIDADAEPGGYVEVPMESVDFGRIAAQTAKQVIVQKVREAEREQVVEEYKEREGEMLSGLVKRVDRNGVYIDLGGNAEGFVARDQMVPREPVRPQDRIKALLTEVRSEIRGPQLFMTRTSPQFLVELFKIEVPEVGQGMIDILGAARDPGSACQDRRQEQRQSYRPRWRLCRHARFARTGRFKRTRGRTRRHYPVGRESGAVRHQRNVAGGSRIHRCRRRRTQHGYRCRRRQAIAGHRPRRSEYSPGQRADRLGTERDDRGGR